MKKLKTLALATAVSAGLLGSAGAVAVTEDGVLGSTSTGTFDITMGIANLARVFGLETFTIAATNPSAPTAKKICIYANTDDFYLDADTANNFSLNDGATVGASYTVSLFGSLDGSGSAINTWSNNAETQESIASVNLAGGDNEVDATCATGNFSIGINPTLEQNLGAGTYTDTVTLIVTPL